MHKLARLLLAISLLELGFSAVTVAVLGGPWPLIVIVVVAALSYAKRGTSLWAHGTARWADESELRRASMLGSNKGLPIGRMVDAGSESWGSSLGCVFESKVPDKEACERFIVRLLQTFAKKRCQIVRLAKSVHIAIFGPTGAGKGASFIVPWLMSVNESAIVLDFKGENAAITARFRAQKFGHRCVILDPFHVVTDHPDCLNPIDFINKDGSNAIDDCRDLAEQLVVRTGEEREPHWNDSAEAWIAAAIAGVVQHANASNRSLQTVRDVLSNPDKIPKLLELLCQTEGMFARLGGQLAYFKDKELSSTLTTANRHLRFLDTPAVHASTTTSSFDPRDLINGKMTVYCVLPPEHMRAQAALIRLWIGSLIRAVVQGGLKQSVVNVILDEAASLGPNMSCLEDAIDKYRGYGIRLQLYYQSPAQLKRCFPNEQDQTVLANCTQVYFAVNDASAEAISNRLGDETIVVESGGTSSGRSSQNPYGGGHGSYSESTNRNHNWSQIGRRLLKPDEILSMSERMAITFVPGMSPILTRLERYYEKYGKEPGLTGSAALSIAIYVLLVATYCFQQAWELLQRSNYV